ncbi:MAG: folylpolyglutamate synthase/dihydrofolate synthase family protein [Candidatus Margulisiibacteriota bacterium]
MNNDYQEMSLSLDRISRLLFFLGNPQQKLRSIHVAGTNGKGTVSRLVHFELARKGYKTGLFTSPHLLTPRERIQIDNNIISEQDYGKYKNRVDAAWAELDNKKEKLTLFEKYTVMSFLYFASQNVDYAVFETGLGGRLDATNIIIPEVSVITNISYDHQDILGNTLEEIAREKAAIIKSNVPVVAGWNNNIKIRNIIAAKANEKQSELLWADPDDNMSIASLALKKIGMSFNPSDVKCGEFHNPGRLQFIGSGRKLLVDGAHNPSSAAYLCDYIRNKCPEKKIIFIVGILKRKDARGVLGHLENIAKKVIFTPIAGQDCYSGDELGSYLSGKNEWNKSDSIIEAVSMAQENARPDSLICITGSLYLIAEYFKSVIKLKHG